jgi:RNA polymerase sigma factor (sigma-70 family)
MSFCLGQSLVLADEGVTSSPIGMNLFPGIRTSGSAEARSISAVEEPLTSEVLERAATDDAEFHRLQRRFEKLVWSITWGFHFDRSTREDIGQYVWLKLYENLRNIREPAALPGWLGQTTRRECLRVVEARSRVVVGTADHYLPPSDEELDANLLRDEAQRAVAAALNELDPMCKQLLRLISTQPSLTYDDVATILDWNVNSVKWRRNGCLKKLTARLAARGITGRTRLSSSSVGDE